MIDRDASPNSLHDDPLSLFVHLSNDLARMARQAALPRAIPVTWKPKDGTYKLIALDFASEAEARCFADGLADFVDRVGARLFLKTPAAINRDERGNVSGIH